jgi:hypothetical protein
LVFETESRVSVHNKEERWFSEVLRELFVKNKRKRRRGWWRREDGRKGGS